MGNWVFLLLAVFLVCEISYSTPVIKGDDNEQQASDKEVKELENLREENQRIDNAPSESSVVQQDEAEVQPTAASKSDEESDEPQPNSRSAIFRHRGITQAKKNKYWNEKVQQVNNPGIQYSPADLAAYVFNTGDEEGVAVAVEELVREGMMGRTDAINYLQDVKQILNDMREQRRKIQEFRKQFFANSLHEEAIKREDTVKVTTAHPAVIASTSEPKEPVVSTTVRPHLDSEKEEDFKIPTYGFTLDVIYKLAKDMFTQSILRDDPTAEETLSGLVSFLESEVGNKRISPAMKEKVLEIVSAALVDSLREYQGIVSENQGQALDGLYLQHPPEPLIPKVPMYRKLGVKGPESMLKLNTINNKPKSS